MLSILRSIYSFPLGKVGMGSAFIVPMSHNVCAMFFDIYPTVPHYLVGKVSVLGYAQGIYHATATVVLCTAEVCLCVAEDNLGTTRVHPSAHTGTFTPVVVPTAYPFYGQQVLVLVIGTGIFLGSRSIGHSRMVACVSIAMLVVGVAVVVPILA